MPTLDELGQKVKAKYPQYAEIPDAELGAKVKAKYPDAYKDFEGTGSTFSKMGASQKAKEHLTSMAGGPAKEQFEQAQASAESDIAAYRAKSDAALQALPFVLAAPFTGGTSLTGAFALMGGAGVAAAAGQEIREAQRGQTKPLSGVLASLGLGGASGLAAEAGGQILGYMGRTLLPKLIVRSAALTEKGAQKLNDAFVATRQSLYQEVGDRPVDIGGPLRKAFQRLKELPVGKGAFGEQFSDLTARAEEVAGNIEQGLTAEKRAGKLSKALQQAKARQVRLENVQSGVQAAEGISQRGREIIAELESKLQMEGTRFSSRQPLNALIREKGNMSQFAWKEKSINPEEQKIFQDLTGDLDAVIRREIGSNPRATALYDEANKLLSVQRDRTASLSLSEKVLKHSIGYLTGGAKGVAVNTMMPGLSTMALERVLTNKLAAPIWAKALALEAKGMVGAATQMATRAFTEAGVQDEFRDAIKNDLSTPEVMQPPAAAQR